MREFLETESRPEPLEGGLAALRHLLDREQEEVEERRLRLRLARRAAWQVAAGTPGRYPRLRPVAGIEGRDLQLLPAVQNGLAAEVELLDLDLVSAAGGDLEGRGWLSLSYREPLWIEHLLRELPLRLVARGLDKAGRTLRLEVTALVLREVVLPEGRERACSVSCRFELRSPEVEIVRENDGADDDAPAGSPSTD